MENTEQHYQKFGKKTLFVLVVKKCALAAFILLVLIIFIIAGLTTIILPAAIIFIIVSLITFLAGWFEYTHYEIFIGEDGLKIKKGTAKVEETGIPYRYIKEVKIERKLMGQLMGVSSVIITVLGEEEGQPLSKESEIILPSIDKNIAVQIQDEILKKSKVEKINTTQNS